ncbi:uncharacterized protein LOC9661706 [Selaginella moellendorffii]|uniref:uncharacterized protein LOC9661706 n=1 Tax=Selaginella moellendorffii TaxID=88036 RepID=UPI000D1D0DF9|nr:uncharacterized protein LOC9661706 [Selaginella moellendorffii]|eukprot:XP_024543545.1 uncharacterized protein LOC9661706 [Selaginella moellendorffii]
MPMPSSPPDTQPSQEIREGEGSDDAEGNNDRLEVNFNTQGYIQSPAPPATKNAARAVGTPPDSQRSDRSFNGAFESDRSQSPCRPLHWPNLPGVGLTTQSPSIRGRDCSSSSPKQDGGESASPGFDTGGRRSSGKRGREETTIALESLNFSQFVSPAKNREAAATTPPPRPSIVGDRHPTPPAIVGDRHPTPAPSPGIVTPPPSSHDVEKVLSNPRSIPARDLITTVASSSGGKKASTRLAEADENFISPNSELVTLRRRRRLLSSSSSTPQPSDGGGDGEHNDYHDHHTSSSKKARTGAPRSVEAVITSWMRPCREVKDFGVAEFSAALQRIGYRLPGFGND